MHPRKKYQCQRVVKINEMIQVFFKCTEREQEELMVINIIGRPDKYKVGNFYWWSDEPAFPH